MGRSRGLHTAIGRPPAQRAHRPTSRLDSLTGLRAVAAFFVFAHHAVAYQGVTGFPAFITSASVHGVSFFFILSGFVLAYSARPGDTNGRFHRRRAARILPLYWIGWLGGAALALVGSGSHGSVAQHVPGLVLLQAWVPDEDVHTAGNSVGWSLSAEASFYLAFPFLLAGLARFGRRGQLAALGGALALTILVPVVLHPSSASDSTAYWASYFFPLTRLLEFIAGVALALLVRGGWRVPVSFPAAAALALGAAIGANWLPFAWRLVAATVVPFTLLILTAAQRDAGGTPTVFASRPMTKLGEWSFAFYLVHLLVLQVTIAVNTRTLDLPWWVVAIGAFLGSGAVAAALCEIVEKPLERRLRGDGEGPASSR